MDCRRWILVAWWMLGCGPVVDPEGDADGGSSDAESSSSGRPQPTTVDVATGDPEPDPRPADLSGDYLLALSAVILPETPLQWRARVVHDPVDGAVTMSLQSLSLDVGSTTSPREPVGESIMIATSLDGDGRFGMEFGEVFIVGAANPITGADIVATLVIEGTAFGPELWCGDAFGMVTAPLMLDLSGSTFALTPIDAVLPDPVVSACP